MKKVGLGRLGGVMGPIAITLSLVSLLFTGSPAQSAETALVQSVPWHPLRKDHSGM